MPDLRVWPGLSYPLGASWDGAGTNFALFSAHATRVELCLFDDGQETARVPLPENTHETVDANQHLSARLVLARWHERDRFSSTSGSLWSCSRPTGSCALLELGG